MPAIVPLADSKSSNMASSGSTTGPFDIVKTYQKLLATDSDLTMPVAAIESLLQLLASTPSLTTISETLVVLNTSIETLKSAVPNSISLSAGTDLFMRYLTTSLRPTSSANNLADSSDFKSIRQHLLSNAQVFVGRAKDARRAIAGTAKRFVAPGRTVLTTGGSRAVLGTLQTAAVEQAQSSGAPRFKVIYVSKEAREAAASSSEDESAAAVATLRALGVPVAVIPEAAVAYVMSKVSVTLVGAEGVVENGGIVSRLGTYQMAVLAKAAGKPVYVVAESHKFVRLFPLGQDDLGFEQRILEYKTDDEEQDDEEEGGGEGTMGLGGAVEGQGPVDYTPPSYITAIVTEAGVMTPSAVSEELIKIWH